jgi:hypothetical protein
MLAGALTGGALLHWTTASAPLWTASAALTACAARPAGTAERVIGNARSRSIIPVAGTSSMTTPVGEAAKAMASTWMPPCNTDSG